MFNDYLQRVTPRTVKVSIFIISIWVVGLAWPQLIHSQTTPVLSVTGVALPTYPGSETIYHLALLNHTDQIVYDGVISITLPVGFTYLPGSTMVMGEGWPIDQREPTISGQTLTWGPYHLPAAGIQVHNPYGIHTLMNDCLETPALHLEGAKTLAGNGGYVTQLFYGINIGATGPDNCAVSFVEEAYARNLIPILRLQGNTVNGVWQAPNPGPKGDYAEIAQAFARYVAGLPRRNTNPLYIVVWNEPDLWIEWGGVPNAAQYARFFVAVSRAIKQLGDARIRVVNGALTPGNLAFLDGMLHIPGFITAFDVWASHCYPYNHPPAYNNHNRTARYGTYTIDCYLQETALINRYGRTNFKVMLTETGYELGNNTFGFEGFASINETNRANYISTAFAGYWQKWPEIVAVTPFQLTDTSGHWAKFDWIHPTPPYTKHLQYQAVAALPKPTSQLKPYGIQITFKAAVAANVSPGIYPSLLRGRNRAGDTAFAPQAAPVQVVAAGTLKTTYLPIVMASRSDGPWYFSTSEDSTPGAIVPNAFLKTSLGIQAHMGQPNSIALTLAGEPQTLAIDESSGLGAVILRDNRLEIVDLASLEVKNTLLLASQPQSIAFGAFGQAYISLENGLARLNLRTGQIINTRNETGRLRGLAWDALTQRILAADAQHDRLLVLNEDLSQTLAAVPLSGQPNQLLLDNSTRQIYVAFPAVPQVTAIDADTLTITAEARLNGGPLLDLALDPRQHRLYALSALAPLYRGLTIWQTPKLSQVALVAGSGNFLWQSGQALAVLPAGQLLTSDISGIWQINPGQFELTPLAAASLAPAGGLAVSRQGVIYALEPALNLLRVYP